MGPPAPSPGRETAPARLKGFEEVGVGVGEEAEGSLASGAAAAAADSADIGSEGGENEEEQVGEEKEVEVARVPTGHEDADCKEGMLLFAYEGEWRAVEPLRLKRDADTGITT